MANDFKSELKGRIISFLSRKFIMTLIIFLVSTYFVLKGLLSTEVWAGVIITDMLSYDYNNRKSKGLNSAEKN